MINISNQGSSLVFAVSRNPREIYKAAGSPPPDRIDHAITNTVVRQAEEGSLNIDTDDDITSILEYGIRDLQDLIHPYLGKQPLA